MSVSEAMEVNQHLKTSSPGLSVNAGEASWIPFCGGGGGLLGGGLPGGGIWVPSCPQPRTETSAKSRQLDRSMATSFEKSLVWHLTLTQALDQPYVLEIRSLHAGFHDICGVFRVAFLVNSTALRSAGGVAGQIALQGLRAVAPGRVKPELVLIGRPDDGAVGARVAPVDARRARARGRAADRDGRVLPNAAGSAIDREAGHHIAAGRARAYAEHAHGLRIGRRGGGPARFQAAH